MLSSIVITSMELSLLNCFYIQTCPVIEANNNEIDDSPVSQRPTILHIQFGLNKCTV